jgi:hypothetical protein
MWRYFRTFSSSKQNNYQFAILFSMELDESGYFVCLSLVCLFNSSSIAVRILEGLSSWAKFHTFGPSAFPYGANIGRIWKFIAL